MTEDRARLRAQDILDPYTECSCPEGWNSCPWCKWGELITAALLSAEATARREGEKAGRELGRMTPKVMLRNCPPGLFEFDGMLGCKSEYKTESLSRPGVWQSDAYCVESGEYFWGGTSDPGKRERLLVSPIDYDTAAPVLLSRNR